MHRTLRALLATALAAATLVLVAAPAWAHEERTVGRFDVEAGWFAEPPFAGSPNGVQFFAHHQDGSAVTKADLQVEVLFGKADSTVKTDALALEPAETAGEYDAFLVPTRPGTYTFHIFGDIEPGTKFDETFTSSDSTFDDVRDASSAQFPAKDPTAGQLASKISRLDARLAQSRSDLQEANDATSRAKTLAIVGIALGAVGVATGLIRRPKAAKTTKG